MRSTRTARRSSCACSRQGPLRRIPEDARVALGVRAFDRLFDNYVSTPMQKIVPDSIRSAGNRDPQGVAEARPYRANFPLGAPDRD